jgi:quercetin dioxygenase-like cupin family protein
MALPHAAPGQAIDVRPAATEPGGARTVALFKSRDLEVMRLVLPAGKGLPPHKVAREITIQCLTGALAVTTPAGRHELKAGQLLYLDREAIHDVRALQDAVALVTVVLPA